MHSYTVTGSFTHDGAQRTITVHHCRDNDHAQEVAETYWLHKGHGTPPVESTTLFRACLAGRRNFDGYYALYEVIACNQ